MPPLQTPQTYYDYFSQEVQNSATPSSAWIDGLHAAECWVQYHKDPDKPSLLLLCRTVEYLMPNRKAGSGFHAFWTTILKTISTLPVQEQCVLWRMIFSATHQGSSILSWNKRAQAIVDQWETLALNSGHHPITFADFVSLATAGGTSFDATPETITLAYAIDAWLGLNIPEPSFIGYLMEQHNRTFKTL